MMLALKQVARAVPSPTARRHLKARHAAALRLCSRLRKQTDYAIDLIIDAILGLSTFSRVPADPDLTARNIEYDPLPYRSLYVIARHLPISCDDKLLDLGCGKGRVLCFFALRRIGKCSGVEISPALTDAARANARHLRGRHSSIEVAQGDAIDAEIGDASIVYMFNPFSAEVMWPVLRRIETSLRARPRGLRICYAAPAQSALLDSCAWLACTDAFVVTWSGWHTCPVTIWSACLDRQQSGSNEGRNGLD